MNRSDLQQLASLRLAEAQALLAAAHFAGAYYLVGYAIECAIKACIAKDVQQYDFPDRRKVNRSWEHKPVELMKAAGLEAEFTADRSSNPALDDNWGVVKDWDTVSRYELSVSAAEAQDMINAVSDPANGVLPWLTLRW